MIVFIVLILDMRDSVDFVGFCGTKASKSYLDLVGVDVLAAEEHREKVDVALHGGQFSDNVLGGLEWGMDLGFDGVNCDIIKGTVGVDKILHVGSEAWKTHNSEIESLVF